jgi:hypothetical protein
MSLKLVWQAPLSVGSWLFYHCNKFLLDRLYTAALARMTEEAQQWQVFCRDTISRPLVLPIIATKGPRWNTHAVLLTAGPLDVQASLAFEVATALVSAGSWSIVVYRSPGYDTVACIESFDIPTGQRWYEMKLAPGKYAINARYYGLSSTAEAPMVRVDGSDVIASKPVPLDSNDFYKDLKQRDSLFYASLHYYVFNMLRARRWLPESFVRHEFLPVGDPGTIFRYDFLLAGETLHISTCPGLLQNYALYLTIYNRSSFPVESRAIRDRECQTTAVEDDGYYLLRLRRNAHSGDNYRDDWLRVRKARSSGC